MLAVVLVGEMVLLRHTEPSYEGRGINEWIDHYAYFIQPGWSPNQPPLREKEREPAVALALAAIKSIGAQGVPYILERVRIGDSTWHKRYDDWWSASPYWLRSRMPKPKMPIQPNMAGGLLFEIGPPGIPYARDALKSSNPIIRQTGLTALEIFAQNSNDLRMATQGLIPELADSVPEFRQHAAYILGEIGPAASNAVPALIINLDDKDMGEHGGPSIPVRAWTAEALGKIGPAASNAVPKLQSMLQHPESQLLPDTYALTSAALALWRISSDEEALLQVANRTFALPDQEIKMEWVDELGKLGPRAKRTVPFLLKELDRASDSDRKSITNALIKIDPEAAAKLLH
jgi:hypothetical protein